MEILNANTNQKVLAVKTASKLRNFKAQMINYPTINCNYQNREVYLQKKVSKCLFTLIGYSINLISIAKV